MQIFGFPIQWLILNYFSTDKEGSGPPEVKLNKKLANVLGAKIASRWKELATALKFPKDDIEYFESETVSDTEHAQKVLTLWMVRYYGF